MVFAGDEIRFGEDRPRDAEDAIAAAGQHHHASRPSIALARAW